MLVLQRLAHVLLLRLTGSLKLGIACHLGKPKWPDYLSMIQLTLGGISGKLNNLQSSCQNSCYAAMELVRPELCLRCMCIN